jgi:hypothetical protein
LRRLEIETHRIKAELARLEANYEDDVADTLSRRLRRRDRPDEEYRFDDADDFAPPPPRAVGSTSAVATAVLPFAAPAIPAVRVGPSAKSRARRYDEKLTTREKKETAPVIVAEPAGAASHSVIPAHARGIAAYRKNATPLMCSFAVHAVALLFCVSFTFVTLVQQGIPLFASPVESEDDIPAPISEIKIEPSKFDDAELQNTLAVSEEFNIADSLVRELEPAQLGAGTKTLGDIGQLDALPSDLGTLMAGAGKPSSGRPGGDLGAAVFFGARSKGDRFVFVIDNSSSMKGGRLEMARAELVRTVESLSPKQSFYVIFVSDQTYPMFYPRPELDLIPATPANVNRLTGWLPNAILASGKNRELIKAMDMAAALRPHAVYLLWDGDMRYSDSVRLDVMTHLTAPNKWNFTVHTLGMNITSLDSEQNLTAIAQAHGGIFRRIDVPSVRTR